MKLTKISIEGVTFEQEGDRNFTNFWCAGGDKVIRYSKSFHSRKNHIFYVPVNYEEAIGNQTNLDSKVILAFFQNINNP